MNSEKDMPQGHDAAAAGGVTPVNSTLSFLRCHKWLAAGACAVVIFCVFCVDRHKSVDLGLSVKWATCNVGASSPYKYGDYFAWGETSPKSEYTEENYKTREKSSGDISGNPKYDAARANWGGKWRMPTEEEMQELLDMCTWTWTSQGGHNGFKVTSRINGNSIFLPAAGWRDGSSLSGAGEDGHYWSSAPVYGEEARFFYFGSGSYCGTGLPGFDRYYGFSIRPVSD